MGDTSADASMRTGAAGRAPLASLAAGVAVVGLCAGLTLLLPPATSHALLGGWLSAIGPWSLPAAILAFAVLAFLGVPQLALIAAAVLAFGPVWGALDSWVATLSSAMVGFWLGRRLGAPALARIGGPRATAVLRAFGRDGFAASLVVRLVPTVPFLAVNMAAGALPIAAIDYAAGTAIGIVPKIALVAVAGGSLLSAPLAHPTALSAAAAATAGWLAITLAAWLWLRRRAQVSAADSGAR